MLKVFNSRRKIQLVAVVVRAIAAVHKNKAGADTQVWVSSQATGAGVFVRKGAGNKETGKHALAGSNWARVCAREERRKGGRGGAGEKRGERREEEWGEEREGGGRRRDNHAHTHANGRKTTIWWVEKNVVMRAVCNGACGASGVCARVPPHRATHPRLFQATARCG